MLTGMNFYYKYATTKIDVDGYYGAQCWDLFAKFCLDNDVPVINCTDSGYVKDLVNQKKSNGILKSFNEVEIMEVGDWAVFGEYPLTPYSHVAMYIGDVDGKCGHFFGQNQGAKIITLPYDTIIGAFRLKKKEWTPSIPNKGTVKAMYDGIIVRTTPDNKKGNTGDWYDKGMSLSYDSIVNKNGRYWLSYVSSKTGKRHYVSYAKEDGSEIFWR